MLITSKWRRRLLLVLICVAGFGWVLWAFLTSFLLHPLRRPLTGDDGKPRTPAAKGLAFVEESFLATDGVKLAAWRIPGEKPGPASKVCVLVHGHQDNRASMLDYLPIFRGLGYDVFAFDLRCHGDSEGDRFTFGYLEWQDVVAAIGHLRRLGYPADRMIGFGGSIGGTVMLKAQAVARPFSLLILDSSTSDMRATIASYGTRLFGTPTWLGRFILDGAEWRAGFDLDTVVGVDLACRITTPTLLMHGVDDRHIPIEHAKKMQTCLAGPVELAEFPRATHAGSLWSDPKRYEAVIREFVTRHDPAR